MGPQMIVLEKFLSNCFLFFLVHSAIVADSVISFHLIDQSLFVPAHQRPKPFEFRGRDQFLTGEKAVVLEQRRAHVFNHLPVHVGEFEDELVHNRVEVTLHVAKVFV